MSTRLPPLFDRALLFVDCGARAKAREHSIEAFARALRLGATGVAVDAWTTRDGVVLIDRSGLVRRFPRRRVEEVEYGAIADSFASLDDLLDVVSHAPLRVSVRDDHTAGAVIERARRRGAAERVWLGHEDLEVLARWRDLAPEVSLFNPATLSALPFGPERRAAELAAARIDAVALPEGDWSGGLVTLFHRFEVAAFADGAHYERQLVRLIDMGIDAVHGDHAERMAAVAAAFE